MLSRSLNCLKHKFNTCRLNLALRHHITNTTRQQGKLSQVARASELVQLTQYNYELRRQRQEWFIVIVDQRVGVHVKLRYLDNTLTIPERFWGDDSPLGAISSVHTLPMNIQRGSQHFCPPPRTPRFVHEQGRVTDPGERCVKRSALFCRRQPCSPRQQSLSQTDQQHIKFRGPQLFTPNYILAQRKQFLTLMTKNPNEQTNP